MAYIAQTIISLLTPRAEIERVDELKVEMKINNLKTH